MKKVFVLFMLAITFISSYAQSLTVESVSPVIVETSIDSGALGSDSLAADSATVPEVLARSEFYGLHSNNMEPMALVNFLALSNVIVNGSTGNKRGGGLLLAIFVGSAPQTI